MSSDSVHGLLRHKRNLHLYFITLQIKMYTHGSCRPSADGEETEWWEESKSEGGFPKRSPSQLGSTGPLLFFFHRALKPRLAARGWSIPLFSASPPSFFILLHLWGVHLRLDFLFYCTFVLMCHREEQTCRGDSVHHHYLHSLIHGVMLNCIKGRSSHQKV